MAGASLTVQNSPASRQIRVFLSSTFRDFMEERDLLVKQVFPELRRKARERGVEVVDVDLRWGVTQEESEQGKVIGICLAEIDRCRPYFIGMLGERYGWTPGKTDYPDELFEREQLGWIRDHQGNASVTELEILHGVLNDKEMAGRAFFYFRDPAWSREQSEPGFVCDTAEEEAKLAALKDRIRASGFPVAEDLPNPKAIADQIEADLWALIEEQYPDLDQADALEKEARKHASYRQSRLGVYLGQEYVDQLEALIHGGEQKILITGESGSGKSALIANWMHQHEQEDPGDVVYAHHLGCSNDANAIRPLLGRMLDTATKLLEKAELITEPIQVPKDWWELTAKLAETVQDLGRWCRKNGNRWIWVLDGLDRLADDDQQALPWLPLLLPEGVSVVIGALDCPAKAILLERQFQRLEIGPLRRNEQEQLIDSYLGRYTKKLDADRVEQILVSPLARSPLFLRVLLEELRQCGRFETLEAQIADYIKPNADGSLTVNDLYGRVLARLERDCGAEPVQKALTALWASRAGLSEPELHAITGLPPLQWAPIDLGLAQALGRNNNRFIFDHNYIREAVENRYLPTAGHRQQAHSELANWFRELKEWSGRKAEELAWQLQQAGRTEDLRSLLLNVQDLYALADERDEHEVIDYWRNLKENGDDELDNLIAEAVEDEIERRKDDIVGQISFMDQIAKILHHAGLFRELLSELRIRSLELAQMINNHGTIEQLRRKMLLAETFFESHKFMEAKVLSLEVYQECIASEADPGYILNESLNYLARLSGFEGDFNRALDYYTKLKYRLEKMHALDHPSVLAVENNIGLLLHDQGLQAKACIALEDVLEKKRNIYGHRHDRTAATMENLASSHLEAGNSATALRLFRECNAIYCDLHGPNHSRTLSNEAEMANALAKNGQHDEAELILNSIIAKQIMLFGENDMRTLQSKNRLGHLYIDAQRYSRAQKVLAETFELGRVYLDKGASAFSELLVVGDNLAFAYSADGKHRQAAETHRTLLEYKHKIFGDDSNETNTTLFCLACSMVAAGDGRLEAKRLIDLLVARLSLRRELDSEDLELLNEARLISGELEN